MSDTFCKFLKNGLVYNNNTDHFTVSPCCYFSKSYSIDSLSDTAEQLVKYKQEWLKEDFKKTCELCVNAEQSGLYSYRQASFDQIQTEHDQFEFLTIAVNKKCNLACPSCDSSSSSFWYQENNRNNVKQHNNVIKLHQEDREGIITEKFLSTLLLQDLSKVTYIKFGGGEPLMSDTHEQILNLIPHPENVTIQYTSNFSIMPSLSVFELWKKFKLVKWVASIDGVGDQFSMLRWPYRAEKLEEFVKKAKETVPGNVMFGVEHTLNPLNVFYYDKFETWFNDHLLENRHGDSSDLNIHLCEGILGLAHTPPALRELVKRKYGPSHKISQSLDQRPYSGSISQIVKYLDQLDTYRNTNWRSTFLEVESFFNV